MIDNATGITALTRTGMLLELARLIESEYLPTPAEISFYERGQRGWGDSPSTVAVQFADGGDLQVWSDRLGFREANPPRKSPDGTQLIFGHYGTFQGWRFNCRAYEAVAE